MIYSFIYTTNNLYDVDFLQVFFVPAHNGMRIQSLSRVEKNLKKSSRFGLRNRKVEKKNTLINTVT